MAVELSIRSGLNQGACSGAETACSPRFSFWSEPDSAGAANQFLRVPLRSMHALMCRTIGNFKVLESVVCFVAVLMVDYFIFTDSSSKTREHHQPMFKCIALGVCHSMLLAYPYVDVSAGAEISSALPIVPEWTRSSEQMLSGHSAFSKRCHGLKGITEWQ